MGYRQTVRPWILIPVSAGSNPASPAIKSNPIWIAQTVDKMVLGLNNPRTILLYRVII